MTVNTQTRTRADASAQLADAALGSWPVFWVASAAVFIVGLDSTMLFAAFASIRASFPAASAADLSWVINAYSIAYAAMLIPAGGFADAYGAKRTFLLGVGLFVGASVFCGLSSGAGWLITARGAQAVGAAMLTPASLALILGSFTKDRRAFAVGLWGAVGGLSAALGPTLGSLVIEWAGWPWAFYLNVPVGALSIWGGLRFLPRDVSGGAPQRVDAIGILLLVVGVGAIALSIVQSESPRWGGRELGAVSLIGVLGLGGFAGWIRSHGSPVVDPLLFRNRTFSFSNLATLTFGATFAMMFFGYFFYLTGVWRYGVLKAGLAISPGPSLVMPVAILTGRLATAFGHRPFLIGGAVLHAAGTLWFLLIPTDEPAYWSRWLPGLALSGIAVGMVLPSVSAAAVSQLPANQFAVGSAVNQSVRQIGSVVGVALIVMMVGSAHATHHEFVPAYTIEIVLALVTALLCIPVNTRIRPLAA